MGKPILNLFIGLLAGLILFSMPAGTTAQSDKNRELKSMILELEKKIADADQRMVAHPTFLEELREILARYKSRLREIFFRDTFNDGNYTSTPGWIVKSGEFSVTSKGHLTSRLPERKASEAPEPQKKTAEQEAVGLILDSIFDRVKKQTGEGQTQKASPAETEPAFLYTETAFPPAFEIKMRFASSQSGEMDILLLGTDKLTPRYRLKVRASHSDTHPMAIIRETGSKQYIIGESNRFPVINDDKFHTLTWLRLTNGEMNVRIDGNLVLKTYEVYYRDNFTGLGLLNTAGSHRWDAIEIFKALPPGG